MDRHRLVSREVLKMRHNARGFTLLEVLIAVFLMAFIMLAVAPLFIHSIEANAAGADFGSVGAIAVDRMEQLRRERLNEVVLQPLSGMDREAYLPKLDAAEDTTRLIETIADLETLIACFFEDAAKVGADVLIGVDKTFLKLARESRSLADTLRQKVY